MISQELWLLEQLSSFFAIQQHLFYLYQIKLHDNKSSIFTCPPIVDIPLIEFPIIEPSTDINIISKNYKFVNNISVRIVNWFVTNYSKYHNTSISKKPTTTTNNNNTQLNEDLNFFVWNQFGSAKSAFNINLFDPYCRNNKIIISLQSIQPLSHLFNTPIPPYLLTSIAQLNFFRWAINYHVLDFIDTHFNIIQNDLNDRFKPPASLPSIKTQNTTHKIKTKREISKNSLKIIYI